jgi:hypothetical protein
MNKYNKSIIYKLEHVSNPELVYIGGTTNFSARKAQHKSRTQNVNDKEYMAYKYKMIRENGGWDMFRMIPIKEISVENKRALEMEEEKVREEYKAKLNVHKAYANDVVVKPSPEAQLYAVLNHEKKLQKYREENAELILKYKNDKPFLNIIKTRKYKPSDYKELVEEKFEPITFTE